MGGKPRLTYEYVYNIFKENNCILLEDEYINNQTKMKYLCGCDSTSSITLANFKAGYSCKKCGINKLKNKLTKFNIDLVIEEFKDKNFILLTDSVVNCKSKITYKCINNHHFTTDIFGFRKKNNNCIYCKREERYLESKRCRQLCKWLRQYKGRTWVIKNMKHDPLYNDYINKIQSIHLDHIIPIKIFYNIIQKYDLDEIYIRKIINNIDNLQLLTCEDNCSKSDSGSIEEGIEYLKNKGVKL
jgi:hypothetical protein